MALPYPVIYRVPPPPPGLYKKNSAKCNICKPRPNDQHISTQLITTLLGVKCFKHLATLLQHVVTCRVLQIELLCMLWSNIVAQTWPNAYNIMQHPQMLHEEFENGKTWSSNTQHGTAMLRYMLGWNVVIVSLSSSPDVPTTGILVPPQLLSQRYNLSGKFFLALLRLFTDLYFSMRL